MVDQWTANSCPWRVEDVSLNGVEWVSRCWSQLYLGRRNFKMSHFFNAIRTIDWRTTWKYPRPMSWISGPWVHWEVCILRCQVGKVSSGEAQLFTLCPGTEKGVFFRENQTFRDTCRWLDMGKQASTCMLIDFGCIPKIKHQFYRCFRYCIPHIKIVTVVTFQSVGGFVPWFLWNSIRPLSKPCSVLNPSLTGSCSRRLRIDVSECLQACPQMFNW